MRAVRARPGHPPNPVTSVPKPGGPGRPGVSPASSLGPAAAGGERPRPKAPRSGVVGGSGGRQQGGRLAGGPARPVTSRSWAPGGAAERGRGFRPGPATALSQRLLGPPDWSWQRPWRGRRRRRWRCPRTGRGRCVSPPLLLAAPTALAHRGDSAWCPQGPPAVATWVVAHRFHRTVHF